MPGETGQSTQRRNSTVADERRTHDYLETQLELMDKLALLAQVFAHRPMPGLRITTPAPLTSLHQTLNSDGGRIMSTDHCLTAGGPLLSPVRREHYFHRTCSGCWVAEIIAAPVLLTIKRKSWAAPLTSRNSQPGWGTVVVVVAGKVAGDSARSKCAARLRRRSSALCCYRRRCRPCWRFAHWVGVGAGA